MIETFTALLFAHVLADFVFQSKWMVDNKASLRGLGAHGIIVWATLGLATGQVDLSLLWLTALHMMIDLGKTRLPANLATFLADQLLHLLTLAVLAGWQPDLWSTGIWHGETALPGLMALLAGAMIATRVGGFAIAKLMETLPKIPNSESLSGAGRMIGLIERGLVFILLVFGQPGSIGLMIAAKSILRFGAVKDDRALSEYVIIGTLASVGWAILAGFATQSLLSALPPLGILPLAP